MSWGEDCNAAREAQRTADNAERKAEQVDHELTMLSRTVDSNRWSCEDRDEALKRRINDLAEQLADAQRTIRDLEARLQEVERR